MSNNPLVDSFEITSSDKDTHFTGAIAQNAFEEENIAFPTDWGLLQYNRAEILNISLESKENLDWEVQFYATDGHADTSDLDVDSYITSILFPATDGKRNAGTGQWKYDANPAHVPFIYHDEDNSSEYHITLVNRSAAAKTAGAAGQAVVKIHANPIA